VPQQQRQQQHPAANDTDSGFNLVQLPSPSTAAPQQFVLLPAAQGLLEVNRVRHEYGAWLVGDRLLADGSCFLCSPVDPAYILLGLLDQQERAAGGAAMFQEASSLLCIGSWPGAAALEALAGFSLPLICDVKGSGEDRYYRLSETRVLAWMRAKLRQTLEGLRAAAPGSVAGLQDRDARAYALGFMAEYLSAQRLQQLAGSCGLAPTGVHSATPAARSASAASPAAAGAAAAGAGLEDGTQQRDKARKVRCRRVVGGAMPLGVQGMPLQWAVVVGVCCNLALAAYKAAGCSSPPY